MKTDPVEFLAMLMCEAKYPSRAWSQTATSTKRTFRTQAEEVIERASAFGLHLVKVDYQ